MTNGVSLTKQCLDEVELFALYECSKEKLSGALINCSNFEPKHLSKFKAIKKIVHKLMPKKDRLNNDRHRTKVLDDKM